ncbi:hypothetical protein [Amycolatopsis lexingtonensis]|uniref:hypothetical protein n=1 Tax=Amycolatopsis lexingtonensis TaxID=218822 RepID=UPI003F702DA5
MFRSFVTWLDSYLAQRGAPRVIGDLVGLLSFAGLMGTIFGSQLIRAGAFTSAGLLVIVVILFLLADRQRLQREYETHRKLLTRYCNFIITHRPAPRILVEEWDQTVYIQRNGDVHERIILRAKAVREEVQFIRLYAGSEWEQPEKQRNKVRVNARSLKPDGKPGPSWNVTKSWLSSNKMAMVVHPHSPIKQGEEIHLEIERSWPQKCRPIMRDGDAENFHFHNGKVLQIDKVTHRVVFPGKFDISYEAIGFEDDRSTGTYITSNQDGDGRTVVTLHIDHVPANAECGMHLGRE